MSRAAKRTAGIAAIAALALLVVLGITKPNPLADTRSYWAEFDSAQGLGTIDRDVRIAGVRVGTMGAVERVDDDVRVELVLFEDYTIHEDARVDMRPHTLFEGSNFVDLAPGSPSEPVLEPGDTIPIEQTANYVTLDEALRILRPEIRTSLRDLAAVGAGTLRGRAVEGFQETLKNAPGLTKSLGPAARAAQGPGRVELLGAIRGLAATSGAVAEREADLVPLVRGLSRTAAGLGVDSGAPLDAALEALPPALRELEATAPSLTATIDRLDRLAIAIIPALPDLALAARDLTPVLKRAIPVLQRARPLIRDARLIAKRLGKARSGLVKMFNLLPEPLELFEPALEVINQETVHGAAAVSQLVAGGFTGFDASFRAFQTAQQNPQAPGHALRVGTEFDFAGIGEGLGNSPQGQVECDLVEPISPEARDVLEAAGFCT
jgi:phospholipid/cholesterol/gamma-HCH transport system substrate-binding protein